MTTSARSTCNLCGEGRYRVRFYKSPYTRVQCERCGLLWSLEQPDLTRLEAMYGEGYFQGATYLDYAGDRPVIEANARARLRALGDWARPPGTVVEVGCATGFFLNVCRQAGWTAKGVELSEYAAAHARDRLGLDVRSGTLEDAGLPPLSAKLVALWDVIEHVPDPMTTLRQSAALLEPGGVLALSTGDVGSLVGRGLGRFWRLMTYDHLYYFSRATIRQYLRAVGLDVMKICHPGRWVSPRLVAHMLVNNHLRIRALRTPLLKVSGRMPNLPLNFGDVMTVYARKPAVGTRNAA